MKRIFFLPLFISVHFLSGETPALHFVNGGSTSIFQPIHDGKDTLMSENIFLLNQQIKIDVFPGYAVVRADYWFNNPSDKEMRFEVGFPSCTVSASDCDEFYWLRIMLNNNAPFAPQLITTDSLERKDNRKLLNSPPHSSWHVWETTFPPGVTEVSMNYGVKTDAQLIANNDTLKGYAMRYSFSNYRYWKNAAATGELWMRMNGGYTTRDVLGLLPDKKFLAGNSILHAAMNDVINDSAHEVLLWYRRLDDTPVIPSQVNWETQFYKVNSWVVNEKILRTLSPFSATDYEGKAFDHEVKSASTWLRWSVIISIIIVAGFLLLFIYSGRKKAA